MPPRSNANLIIPRLWLGNKEASTDDAFLAKNNITVVFNCTKDLPFTSRPIHKYRVPIDDNLQTVEINNLTEWSGEIVFKVLREYNKGNTILIHCFAGMQRSAAVMAMVLITMTLKPSSEIMAFIREKRSIAFFPQANFERSILEFEKRLQKEFAKQRR
jgi:dual specificity MAP kinase phosphatase